MAHETNAQRPRRAAASRRVTHRDAAANDATASGHARQELAEARRRVAESARILDVLLDKAPVGLGFLDCDLRVVRCNEVLASFTEIPVHEQIGQRLSDILPPAVAKRVVPMMQSALERDAPVVDYEMAKILPNRPGQTQHHLVSYYPVRVDGGVIGLGVVVVDITERKAFEEARLAVGRAAVDAVAATIEARDPYTAGHQRRVAEIASLLAEEMGLPSFEIEGISLASSIHDIGKIRVPAEILARPGPLHPAEFELVKTHSEAGAAIVRGIKFPWPVAEMIHQHHERFDGAGYPEHLAGSAIVLGARIIAVADALEAMASHRPYRAALGTLMAVHETKKGRGSAFDPDVVDALLRVVETGRLPRLDAIERSSAA